MPVSDCAKEIVDAFRGRGQLSESNLRFITEMMRKRVRDGQGQLDMPDAQFAKVAKQIAADALEAAHYERRAARENAVKLQKIVERGRLTGNKFNDPSLGLESALGGTNTPFQSSRISAEGEGKSLFGRVLGMMTNEMENSPLGDLFPHFNNKLM